MLTPEPDRAAMAALEGHIVFTCDGQIWTARPDGTGQTQLTHPVAIDWDRVTLFRVPESKPPSAEERAGFEAQMNSSPRWLSDGRIAFASIRDTLQLSAAAPADAPRRFVGASELYVVNGDGTGEQRVTDYNLTPGSYKSSHGEVFDPAMDCLGPNFCFAGLLTIRPLSAHHAEPLLTVRNIEIRFSECCSNIVTVDLAGNISALPDILGPTPEVRLLDLDWSGDDRPMLVTVLKGETIGSQVVEARLYAGGTYTTLPQVVAGNMSLSPDATQVAYCNRPAPSDPWTLGVYTVGEDSARTLATFAVEPPTSSCDPRWSPDGTHLVVADGQGRILVVDVATGGAVPVAAGAEPDWGP